MAVSFQILMNPEDCVGSVYNRKVAMHCLWTMHRARFKPSSIINVGVGSAPELKIWRWILPTVPILAIDPREKYSRRRRGYRGFRYVQAIAGETDGESVFCQACRSIQCKCQATHEAAGRWKKFKTATIDNLVSEFGLKPPHFVWMDIDGGEVSALSGATETLKNTGWLCVELTNWVPRHVRDILKLLHRRGFVLKVRFSKDGLFRNGRFFKRGMSWFLPERRALFLHVPRTGGTWIKEAMFHAGVPMDKWGRICEQYRPRKHTIIPHIRPELWAKVTGPVFAFVRHPVAYYVSVWRFTCRAWKNWPDKMPGLIYERNDPSVINEAVLRWKPSFNEWLDGMLEEEPGWATRWFERYVGPQGGEFCHYIGRTETIEQDLEQILQMLGYGDGWDRNRERIAQIHHAKNRIREFKAPNIVVTDEQRARIERSERVTIRRFYGEETVGKRVYRDFDTGEPV